MPVRSMCSICPPYLLKPSLHIFVVPFVHPIPELFYNWVLTIFLYFTCIFLRHGEFHKDGLVGSIWDLRLTWNIAFMNPNINFNFTKFCYGIKIHALSPPLWESCCPVMINFITLSFDWMLHVFFPTKETFKSTL